MVIPSKRLLALNIRLGLKLTPHFKWNAKDARRVVSLLYHPRKYQHSCSNALSLQESDPTKNAVLLPYLGRWCLMLTVQPHRVQKQLYGLVGNELFSILQLLSHKWNVANHSQLYCYYYQDSYQSWKPWKIDSLFQSLKSPGKTAMAQRFLEKSWNFLHWAAHTSLFSMKIKICNVRNLTFYKLKLSFKKCIFSYK